MIESRRMCANCRKNPRSRPWAPPKPEPSRSLSTVRSCCNSKWIAARPRRAVRRGAGAVRRGAGCCLARPRAGDATCGGVDKFRVALLGVAVARLHQNALDYRTKLHHLLHLIRLPVRVEPKHNLANPHQPSTLASAAGHGISHGAALLARAGCAGMMPSRRFGCAGSRSNQWRAHSASSLPRSLGPHGSIGPAAPRGRLHATGTGPQQIGRKGATQGQVRARGPLIGNYA